MANPVHCRCGALLVEDLTEDEVKPVGGESIRFRRTTDFIVCPECHSVYRVSDLRGGQTADESFIGKQESGESLVDALERLLATEVDGDARD